MSCKRRPDVEVEGDNSLPERIRKRFRTAAWREIKDSKVVLRLGPGAEEYKLLLLPLVIQSEYFQRHIDSNFDDLEEKRRSPIVIDLPDLQCDKYIFRIVDDFCTGLMEDVDMSTSNIVKLFSASKFLEMKRLQARASRFLEENVFTSSENCLAVLATFDASNLPCVDGDIGDNSIQKCEEKSLFEKCRKEFLSIVGVISPPKSDECTTSCNVECLLRAAEVLPMNVAKHIYQSCRAKQFGLFLSTNVGRQREVMSGFPICKQSRGDPPDIASASFFRFRAYLKHGKEGARWVEQLPQWLPDLSRRSLLISHLSKTMMLVTDLSQGICSVDFEWGFLCALLVEATRIRSSGDETSDRTSDEEIDFLQRRVSDGLLRICLDGGRQEMFFDGDQQENPIVELVMKFDFDTLVLIVRHVSCSYGWFNGWFNVRFIVQIAGILDCCIGKHLQAKSLTHSQALTIYKQFPNETRPSHLQLYQTLAGEVLTGEEARHFTWLLDYKKLPDDIIEKLFDTWLLDYKKLREDIIEKLFDTWLLGHEKLSEDTILKLFDNFDLGYKPELVKRFRDIQRGQRIDKEKREEELVRVRSEIKVQTADFKKAKEDIILAERKLKLELKKVSDLKNSNEKLIHLQSELGVLRQKQLVIMQNELGVRNQELSTVTEAKILVKSERDALKHDLEAEKEKNACQICFKNPRDALSLPCMHFHYCSDCLKLYHRQTRTCPTCEECTVGVLKCILDT